MSIPIRERMKKEFLYSSRDRSIISVMMYVSIQLTSLFFYLQEDTPTSYEVLVGSLKPATTRASEPTNMPSPEQPIVCH